MFNFLFAACGTVSLMPDAERSNSFKEFARRHETTLPLKHPNLCFVLGQVVVLAHPL